MTIEEAFRHAGPYIRDWEYAETRGRDALPKYMWFHIDGKERTGYCTHCQHTGIDLDEAVKTPGWVAHDPYIDYDDAEHWETELELSGPRFSLQWNGVSAMDGSSRHGHFGRCPHCGMVVQYRSLRMGRKGLRDRAFLIRWEESAIEPGTLVMLGWLVWTDWGKWDEYNEHLPEMNEELREICVFRPGEGGSRFVLDSWTTADYENGKAVNFQHHTQWVHRKKCVGGHDPVPGIYYAPGTKFYLDTERFDNALDEVPYGEAIRLVIEGSANGELLDRIDAVHFVTRYPCMEYLEKLGLGGLAAAEYNGKRGELLNLRGKTAQRVLRVDADTWGWIKGHKAACTPNFLRMRVLLRGGRLGNDLIARMAGRWNVNDLGQTLKKIDPGQAARAVRYMWKKNVPPHDYRDYLEQIDKLAMAHTPDALYPPDFEEMHRRLVRRIKVEGSKAADRKIAAFAEERLGVYWFSALGLTLRPMLSSGEIIKEGTVMHHCVGGYVDRYAAGETILLALRKDEDLSMPWHTVEFSKDGRLIQCRGYRNHTKPEDQPLIDEFWRLFDAYRIEYEQQHNREKRKEHAA